MKPLTEIYTPSFFCRRHKLNWKASVFCEAVTKVYDFSSVVDVGCAVGDIVTEFARIGKFSKGIEGSASVLPYLQPPVEDVLIHDMRLSLPGEFPKFDLATCLEVAEHIEPEYADTFVYNLTRLSNDIILSIAPPGQGGHYHVNCREMQYWDTLFKNHGYTRVDAFAKRICIFLYPYRDKSGIKAYYYNLHSYTKL